MVECYLVLLKSGEHGETVGSVFKRGNWSLEEALLAAVVNLSMDNISVLDARKVLVHREPTNQEEAKAMVKKLVAGVAGRN